MADKLVDEGYEVIYPAELREFLEKNNIVCTGYIDRINAKKIKRAFKVSSILLGSIIEKNRNTSAFGITMRLLYIPEYKLIWASTSNFKKSDLVSFLNLNKLTFDEIIKKTVTASLKGIPDRAISKIISKPDVDIQEIFISPKYTSKGKDISLKVKLKFFSKRPDLFYLLISKKRFPVKPDVDTISFSWKAPASEGRYTVSLSSIWGKPYNLQKKLFLTSFFIDNTPPQFKLHYKFTTKFKGKSYFNRFIRFYPVFKTKEKISHWKLTIKSVYDNSTVATLENYKKLPSYFTWKGLTVKKSALPNGEYIITLKLWDRANNLSESSFKTYLVKSIVPPAISAEREKGKIILKIKSKEHPLPITFSRIEVFDNFGNLIASKESDNLFKKIAINNSKFDKIFVTLMEKDLLGNHFTIKRVPLNIKERKKKKQRNEKKWINEF